MHHRSRTERPRRFQSAPPAEARGDKVTIADNHRDPDVSIRSPRRSEGRLLDNDPFTESEIPVSIRSPRRSEGRFPQLRGAAGDPAEFQSAPPAEARGDHGQGRRGDSGPRSFNPLPPPKRGEIVESSPEIASWIMVSIRSPRRSEGRSACRKLTPAEAWSFNPLPPPKRGEIYPVESILAVRICFNPLPPPKRGEIAADSESFAEIEGFQSAPPAEARGD